MTRILIVDDEISIRQMLRQFLETRSYQCVTAGIFFWRQKS